MSNFVSSFVLQYNWATPKTVLRFMSHFNHLLPVFDLLGSIGLLHLCTRTQNSIGKKLIYSSKQQKVRNGQIIKSESTK